MIYTLSSILFTGIEIMKDIEITKILFLAQDNRYELTCAGFDVIDHINKIDLPGNLKNSLKTRKLAVQALTLLSEKQVQFGYEENAPSSKPIDSEEE